MKLVGLVAKAGEPGDQRVPDAGSQRRRRKNAVMLDRQRIESRVAGLVQVERTRANQPAPPAASLGAEQCQRDRFALTLAAQQLGPARRRHRSQQGADPMP